MDLKTKMKPWDECSRCGTQIERACDGHIFCFYPNIEYTPELMDFYCKKCTDVLFREMRLEILLKELTHLSLNFEFAFPILLKKLNNRSDGYYEDEQESEQALKSPIISDNGSRVTNCDRCCKYIYYNEKEQVYFMGRRDDSINVYCQECCKIEYTKMGLLEMVKEMMSGAEIQKIGFKILKEKLKEREE